MNSEETYRVLARKYRPVKFSDLIGQDVLVRTITNAIRTKRLAHAFLFTGVRGVGKTTTARILARALNCLGQLNNDASELQSKILEEPCGDCDNCIAIFEDRHVDVIEMDAASHTGVDDIRELINGVKYRPTNARYKVYIIDEVHMLSKQAFNALLKTLEEPPPHAKFIFATTEVRKIPVTVISRCQRFDLRRVQTQKLSEHLQFVSEQEGIKYEIDAVYLIARAADGSVRDGLSLLDQIISNGSKTINEQDVRNMLGLADRVQVFEIFTSVMEGNVSEALSLLRGQYQSGADPITILEDSLEITHWITKVKLVPELVKEHGIPEIDRKFGTDLAKKLSMPELTRAWSILLNGLKECKIAPNRLSSVEMIIIRLAFVADLPSPEEAVRKFEDSKNYDSSDNQKSSNGIVKENITGGDNHSSHFEQNNNSESRGKNTVSRDSLPAAIAIKEESISKTAKYVVTRFRDIIDLAAKEREMVLRHWLVSEVHLVSFIIGQIELRQSNNASTSLAGELTEKLQEWTGNRWVIALSDKKGDPTVEEQLQTEADQRLLLLQKDTLVKKVLETFPDANISGVRNKPETDKNT